MNNARSRASLSSLLSRAPRRPPATPARRAVGAVLFVACALGAWLTIPRPELRVMNASGQTIAISVRGGEARASRTLGVDRVWAVEQQFPAGEALQVQVTLPGGVAVQTALGVPAFPLRVAVEEDGTVRPR